MPIPTPNKDEDKQRFTARCMSNETMKKEYPDSKQRLAVCLTKTKADISQASLIDQVQDKWTVDNCEWDENWEEFTWEVEASEIFDEDGKAIAAEKPVKVKLNKPFRTPGGPKKFSVYVKNDKGNIVKVNFGDPNMSIKRDDPERRKSFRARHKCDTDPGPKWKARYWSCKMWSDTNVSDLT